MPNSCRARFKASFQQSSELCSILRARVFKTNKLQLVVRACCSFGQQLRLASPLSLALSHSAPTSLRVYKLFILTLQSVSPPALERGVAAPLGPYKLLVKLNLYGSAGIFWQIVYKLWPQRAYTQKLFIFSPLCCACSRSNSLSLSCCLFRMLFPSCCPLFCHCSK